MLVYARHLYRFDSFINALGCCGFFCTLCYQCRIAKRIHESCASVCFGGMIPMRTRIRTERKIKVCLEGYREALFLNNFYIIFKGSICTDCLVVVCCINLSF